MYFLLKMGIIHCCVSLPEGKAVFVCFFRSSSFPQELMQLRQIRQVREDGARAARDAQRWGATGNISCDTPWKINMEPTNHPFRKENDLPNLHDYGPC